VGDERGLWARIRDAWASVRVRTTVAAIVVVGGALVVAAATLVVTLRSELTEKVGATALLRARTMARSLDRGGMPSRGRVPVTDPDDEFIQILDAAGEVVASSPNVEGRPAVARLAPGRTQQVTGVGLESTENDRFVVGAATAGTRLVLAGATLDPVTETTLVVRRLLTLGVPILLVVMAAVAWLLVGRALAPVEAMRSEVEAISAKELHRRVPALATDDEIGRLSQTMNRMLARLQDSLARVQESRASLQRTQARLRRFVSDAAHELRSPVASIRQHAEVALSHPDAITGTELAEVVLEEDARLARLVDDLLLLSKADEGSLAPRRESVDLDDLLLEEAARLRGATPLRIDVRRVSAGRVSGDRAQLARLVRNLTENAARHAHSRVALSLNESDGGVVLGVEDDGDGIPPSQRERIFERFVRLDEGRDRDSGGSGLGLAIVAEIADVHGAAMTVGDGSNGGARMELRFPAQES
jgi:signal transduction histidine kinase